MSSPTFPLTLTSRSRASTDNKCRRSYHHAYLYGGRGLSSTGMALELYMGSTLHDALSAIAAQHKALTDYERRAKFISKLYQDGATHVNHDLPLIGPGPVNIDAIAEKAQHTMYQALLDQTQGEPEADAVWFAKEQACLVEGLIRGFFKTSWPGLIEAFPVIKAIEQEMVYDAEGFRFMAKPDLVLADEADENWVYIEYKSTSSKRPEWVNQWNTAIQLQATVKAIQATLGVLPSVVIVQGLYKGWEAYGKQTSPFCYGYKKASGASFLSDEISYDYKAGYKKFPVWDMAGGSRAWVESMLDSVLVDQFPQSPPIYIKDDLIDAYFRQRIAREREIRLAVQMLEAAEDAAVKEAIMDISFPQNFDQCNPGFGKPCGFRSLCHGGVEDPLQSGFAWRDLTHEDPYKDIPIQSHEL